MSTKIEWTDDTWNPVRGCTRVSPGCGGPNHEGGCYAEKIAARFSGPGQPFHGFAERTAHGGRWTGKVALASPAQLLKPLSWKRPRRIFVNSMSDLFHENLSDDDIDQIFAVMALCPRHVFQILSKRPERMRAYAGDPRTARRIYKIVCDLVTVDEIANVVLIAPGMDPALAPQGQQILLDAWPLRQVWLGVSVEDQARADERIPLLLDTPAAIRFISAEPLLGPLDISPYLGRAPDSDSGGLRDCVPDGIKDCAPPGAVRGIIWTICGGESGPGARPMHPDWARALRDQCAAASVPFFFKQWGEWRPAPDDIYQKQRARRARNSMRSPAWSLMERAGKKHAGRLLDGREHNGMPEAAP